MEAAENRDPQLWHKAQDRARFKTSLFNYVWVNAMLWAIWYLTGAIRFGRIPWPMWSTVFWGLALVLHAFKAYSGFTKSQLSEREYERLQRERGVN